MLHFVFRFSWTDRLAPVASSPEIADLACWPIDALPTPIPDFTELRIRDAMGHGPPHVARVRKRHWLA
jgi:hypothetical protein